MVSEKVLTEQIETRHDYELMLLINPEVVDERLEAVVDSVSRFVTGKGGELSNIERWGKKRLAYPIKHFAEGSYVLVRFKLKPAFTRELDTNLRITEEVLRHLLVKLD